MQSNKSKMSRKRGFTLIELLVVVLIIGILAAVAVPQYKTAVEKTRLTRAIVVLKIVKEAQERYFLANGHYTQNIQDLDIDYDDKKGDRITLPSEETIYIASDAYTYVKNKDNTNSLVFYYDNVEYPKRKICMAKQGDTVANRVCKSLGGKNPENSSGCAIGSCTIYEL